MKSLKPLDTSVRTTSFTSGKCPLTVSSPTSSQGNQLASIETPHTATHHGGMTGGFCSGSSNGSDPNSAILVCTIPYNDANQEKTNGRLLVYDPIHLAADGSLKLLWDSQAQGIPFLFNKFNPPIIDSGQIYVPNYSGGVDLYRLTP